jgi:xanthine dehydrogenase accessory factor
VKAFGDLSGHTASGLETLLDTSVMIDLLQPRAHMIIVGGVHIAMALSSFARMLGMRVTLIEPRSAFATPERFPGIEIYRQFPAKALANVNLGAQTFLAILTHDPKIDDPAVIAGLNSSAAYVGVLGSQRTHQQRLERLRKLGFSEETLKQLHAPIGLAIGAKTPEEIAVAIMAQIIAVKNDQP